ncbi:MAG: cytochrome c, partial [Pseudomonadota bacterium]|nr:cytochrome c [Pseudomonadota bacterium]
MTGSVMKRHWLGALAGLGLLGLAGGALAQPAAATSTPGETLYQARCAACHDHPAETRALAKDVLAQMPPERIESALTEGKMKPMAAGLSATDRAEIIRYLTGKSMAAATLKADWAAGMMCPADRRTVDLSGPATVSTFGFDRHNTRTLTARQAGLTKAQLSNLELAWSIAIPGATSMRSQPAIVGKTVFLPVADDSTVYAF